jgi:hypothetical protein
MAMPQIYKKKFQWTAEWRDARTWQLIAPPAPVKIDSRPSLSMEVLEVDYLKSSFYIPGKAEWQESRMTYWDFDKTDGGALFFRWVSEQYKASDQPQLWTSELACVILRLHDGSFETIEEWYLDNAVITALDFGSVYGDESELNVAIKYRDADYVCPDRSTWLKPLTESSSSC